MTWQYWQSTSVVPRRSAAALLLVATVLAGCSGNGTSTSGGVITTPVTAVFAPSGSAAAPDLVRLRGGAISGEMATIEVAISGPTQSDDLHSFAFDLVLSDPSVASFVGGSAEAGDALTGGGVTVLATRSRDRVIVGVTQAGVSGGNGIGASEEVIVRLTFRVQRVGTTGISIDGPPQNPAGPVALDSTGAVIGSVVFDSADATLGGV